MKFITSTALLLISLNSFANDPSLEQVRQALENLNQSSFGDPDKNRETSRLVDSRIATICERNGLCALNLRMVTSCFTSRWTATNRQGGPRPTFRLTVDNHFNQWRNTPGATANRCAALIRGDGSVPVTVEAALATQPAVEPREPDAPAARPTPDQRPAESPAPAGSVQLSALNPDSCKWVTDLPRRIINSPGCTASTRNRICTGFVSCEQRQGGARLIRLSTCRAEHCGNGDANAVSCTKDMSHSSSRPSPEAIETVSPRVNQAVRQ